MVTTSAAPAAPVPWLAEPGRGEIGGEYGVGAQSGGAQAQAEPAPVRCAVLTPSGALLARAVARPRPASLPDEAYAVELSQVQPRGALEPLLRANPQVILRTPDRAQLAARIDHIVGPRDGRRYYLQTLDAGAPDPAPRSTAR